MVSESREVKARENWINIYKTLGSISKAARKCGLPRSTLYRWVGRYKIEGAKGLISKSKKPKYLAKQKVDNNLKEIILSILDRNVSLLIC